VLKEMGIPPTNIDALFANPAVIRSVRHQMVTALKELNLVGTFYTTRSSSCAGAIAPLPTAGWA
jgi:hypothetical protein